MKNKIKLNNDDKKTQVKPSIKPAYTCIGVCRFNINLDVPTSPETTNAIIIPS